MGITHCSLAVDRIVHWIASGLQPFPNGAASRASRPNHGDRRFNLRCRSNGGRSAFLFGFPWIAPSSKGATRAAGRSLDGWRGRIAMERRAANCSAGSPVTAHTGNPLFRQRRDNSPNKRAWRKSIVRALRLNLDRRCNNPPDCAFQSVILKCSL